jgi:large subunit ribosomal protein L24
MVIAGKDKGRKGTVIKALPKEAAVAVEGMNIKKRHRKPRQQGQKGQIVETPAPFNISNVKLVCTKCNKAVRVGYSMEGDTKFRVCKKCGKET